MRNTHISGSRLWEMFCRRVFRRRRHRESQESSPTESDISEHTDGFYLYSQSVIEEEESERLAALKLQTSQTTDEMSFASARMEPYREPLRPYTIGDVDWSLGSPSRASPINNIIDDEFEDGLNSVLAVFSKVYSVAKILSVALVNYGLEPENSRSGIALHIKRAEEVVTSNSAVVLIETVEGLYYSLQARLITEMASVELCSSFTLDVHHLRIKDTFTLPHPRQLYNIFLSFKETLDSPTVCCALDSQTLREHEESFILRSIEKVAQSAFTTDDFLGYRRFIMGVMADKSSSFNRKWTGLSHVYQMPPPDVLLDHSEKYLSIVPKATDQYDVPASELPYVDLTTIDSDEWNQEMISSHRSATLAQLERKSVGEIRREDRRRTVMGYVREKRCVCFSACVCAMECTNTVERQCPCAERMLRMLLALGRQVPGNKPLGLRCASLARAAFEGLALNKGNTESELAAEIDRAIMAFENEVWVQRDASPGP
ncbi:hypothetical protein PHISP_03419 [Aspergillus sp. HF37]|nr:hypothetical protein PHISP_03419 [Aspergillus sp. HF37]